MRIKSILTSALNTLILISLPISAQAAMITFAPWTLGSPTVTTSSSFAAGSGKAMPHLLQVIAGAAVDPLSPSSYFSENATATISASSFFTVNPQGAETVGQQVPGFLTGSLTGVQVATGFDILELTGSYSTSVSATVNAGFASWTSPGSGTSISGSVLVLDAVSSPVNIPFNVPGILEIGKTYPFSMELTTSASKTGAYQVLSKFNDGLTATVVVAAPEPTTTILGSFLALGFGALLKRENSRIQKKKNQKDSE
ncbi:MAG: PEP-CTERM sorting domain-containing protein [Hormoscilla sp.]